MRDAVEIVSFVGFVVTTLLNARITKRDKARGMGRDLSPARAVVTVINAVFMLMALYFFLTGHSLDLPSIS
ncbi:MAG: hypothetical protein IJ129_02650 [Ruminococcus sp.]|nr:hypothetical protein [Ruminococcus sp.]